MFQAPPVPAASGVYPGVWGAPCKRPGVARCLALSARRASTKLHNQLFRRVLSAPILFFLRTPVGDVLNAFARDQVRAVDLTPCARL